MSRIPLSNPRNVQPSGGGHGGSDGWATWLATGRQLDRSSAFGLNVTNVWMKDALFGRCLCHLCHAMAGRQEHARLDQRAGAMPDQAHVNAEVCSDHSR